MRDGDRTGKLLAGSAGYDVYASDGPVGVVDTPLFPPDAARPDFLVLQVGSWPRVRRPILSVSLVEKIDATRRTVHVSATRIDIASLSECLPIAI
jgi:hypothetical protein